MKFREKLYKSEQTRRAYLIKAHFTDTWDNKVWVAKGVVETRSGCGSTMQGTKIIRELLLKIIDEYNIKIITDAACGDLNWISKIDMNIDRYVGYDIVEEMIESNIKKCSDDVFSFKCENIITADLPKSDLIVCRYCFQHWSSELIKEAILNFKRSCSKYLLATSHSPIAVNRAFRQVDLEEAPFNFPKPIISVKEDINPQDKKAYICLWELDDIKEECFNVE
jgi:hypothetical protein